MHPLATTFRLLVTLCAAAPMLLPLYARAQAQAAGGPATALQAPPPEAQRRVALVVGNAAYETSPLPNPVNDARAMAQVLREAGFTVLLHTDVDQRQLMDAVREFGERLSAGGGTGLFYFAGHGMQIKGRNFLIPVRSNIVHEDEVAYAALDAQAVLDKMESAGNGTNILVLDACRNNPFARSFRGNQQGLAQMDAPVGTLISFATAPGSVAIDNLPGQRNGLFTTHLLEAIQRPGLKVEDVLKQVRQGVLRASRNRQVPWEASALVGDFYFHPPRDAGALPGAAPAVATPAPAQPAQPAPLALVASADPEADALLRASSERLRRGMAASLARTRSPTEALITWGEADPQARPAKPRQNSQGFAEGDRFRYLLTDLRGLQPQRHYLWRVDRIGDDGSLWVNDGSQRLDEFGQRRGGIDEVNNVWLDFDPPLPLHQAAMAGAGRSGRFNTAVRVRDGNGRLAEIVLGGEWRTRAVEVRPPRHFAEPMRAMLVEFELTGESDRGSGVPRTVWWTHRYWWVPELLVPVKIEIDEIEGDTSTRRVSMHELVAVDVLSPAR